MNKLTWHWKVVSAIDPNIARIKEEFPWYTLQHAGERASMVAVMKMLSPTDADVTLLRWMLEERELTGVYPSEDELAKWVERVGYQCRVVE